MNSQTLNYAVVAVGIVVTYSLGFWIISAKHWFKGPVKQIAGEHSNLAKHSTLELLSDLLYSRRYGDQCHGAWYPGKVRNGGEDSNCIIILTYIQLYLRDCTVSGISST